MVTLFKLKDGSPARDFKSVEEMDEIMINRWNEVVRAEDHVWHLGDVSFIRPRMDSIFPRLMGHKRLILGNHDKFQPSAYSKWFQKIRGSQVHDGLLMTHIPIAPWSFGKFKANVHGHVHSTHSLVYKYKYKDKDGEEINKVYVNVSVEAIDYRPISLEEVQKIVRKEL